MPTQAAHIKLKGADTAMKNACIVGYGAIGPVHAKAISEAENANFYAVCDIDKSKLNLCKSQYDVTTYNDFDAMLSDDDIDCVHICTPHYLHKDMAVKAMRAGKCVVLEKPVAMNDTELDELLSVQKETGAKVCVMLQNRMNRGIQTIKDISLDLSLGKLIGIEGSLMWRRGADYYRSAPWRGTWRYEGGGLLINQAVHLIDLIDYVGGGIRSVRASISTKLLDNVIEVEDTADALLTMNSGIRACFYAANTYEADKPLRLELQYENALLRYADNRLYKITDSVEILAEDSKNTLGKKYWGNGHPAVIAQFYHSLEKGGEFLKLEDSINSTRALFAFYKSSKAGGAEIKI